MRIPSILLICSIIFLAACNQFKVDHSPQSLPRGIVLEYFLKLDQVQRAGSTVDDIEQLVRLTTEDVHYVHVNFKADFDRNSWATAFEQNLNAGRYDYDASFCTLITQHIEGKGSVAVEYARGDSKNDVCVPSDERRYLAVFRIAENKISRIEELW